MDIRKISAYLQMCTVGTTGIIRHIIRCVCMVMEPRPKKLLDQLREVIRLKHYTYRTEETYVQWVKRFILFHEKRHPREMGRAEIEAFLTDLAVQQQVAASTQNQALNAILFLYREVLSLEVAEVNAIRAKRTQYFPTVLTKAEAPAVIQLASPSYSN